MDDNEHLLRIRMTHAEAHPSFPASFRRPPHTSEFKLETTPKPVSVPVPVPQPPPPPPPIFANMQHPPHLIVEPAPPAGHPPVHPTIPPPPALHPETQEEEAHPVVENTLAAEEVAPQARHSPVRTADSPVCNDRASCLRPTLSNPSSISHQSSLMVSSVNSKT